MNYYFYQDRGSRKGPYTYKELKSKRLLASTLVWTEGMDNWMQAKLVDELKEIVISEPPPVIVKKVYHETPNEKSTINKDNVENEDSQLLSLPFDPNFKTERDAASIGVGLMLLSLVVYIIVVHAVNDNNVIPAVNAIFVLARIPLSIYIVQITKRLNRNPFVWGIFGFFLPTFTLIIIGLLKKKMLKNIDLSNYITKEQKVEHCLYNAEKNFRKNRYTDSLVYLNRLLDLDPSHNEARFLRGRTCLELKLYQKAKFDFEQIKNNNKYSSEVYYYLGDIDILNHNREQAIKNWIRSNELGYSHAKKRLDLYHNFTGIYILNERDRCRKLINKQNNPVIYAFDAVYLSGFKGIDGRAGQDYYVIHVYDNGLEIRSKLENEEQSINYAIAFYEITEMKHESKNLLIIELFGGERLTFKLTNNHRSIEELFILSNLYKTSTGNTII